MRSDGAFRPHKAEDRSLDVQSMELPERRRCRHAVLSIGNVQDLLFGLLVLPEATGNLKTGPSGQLRTQSTLPLERRSATMAGGIVRFFVSGQEIEG